MDVAGSQADVVNAAVALQTERPDIGMLLLECGDLPPYAHAVSAGDPNTSLCFTSMVQFFVEGLVRYPFTGLL
ncbi:MAG: hypothetical protein E5W01_03130 [Mesorhizobium sp.]|nr:hypothetical protein EOA91_12355 [Mesorhizobium sp. M1A.F.Ca.IN.022.04.1.1]TIS18250.1 MAG: hypothetical protein E5X10_00255 [Mesorhizobium sp.]TIU81111.1 MAG: hypothetical protein E5W13_00045 [Mesorhizobium sp.]TIU93755.1 MAG: hypothetical protein E5W01_03130 [Mesorhizobium sp.]TIV10740.1 MAG: hypothetical protein E5W00_06395 [Mesorhizobium sp.]